MINAALSAFAQAAPQLPQLPQATQAAQPTQGTFGAGATAGLDGGFGDVLADAVNSVAEKQNKADNLAVQAATGELRDVQDYVIAATEAQVATELAVNIRNRAVEAFQQIMQMAI
jgi:flagellar hook-basal body complex protein FliE